MKFTTIATLLATTAPATAATFPSPYNPFLTTTWPQRIPTAHESAIIGRRLLALSKVADLASVYPSTADPSIAGLPTSMMDYIGDCEEQGNPTILKLDIATTFKNAAAGSNVTVSLRWIPPYAPAKRMSVGAAVMSWLGLGHGEEEEAQSSPDTIPYSAANLPRVSLMGYIELIGTGEMNLVDLAKCFVETHPDAKYWLPGNLIHRASWVRLVVEKIYWVGGFGDRAYIGWIEKGDWNAVTREQWEKVTLPGEKPGWSEWSVAESIEV